MVGDYFPNQDYGCMGITEEKSELSWAGEECQKTDTVEKGSKEIFVVIFDFLLFARRIKVNSMLGLYGKYSSMKAKQGKLALHSKGSDPSMLETLQCRRGTASSVCLHGPRCYGGAVQSTMGHRPLMYCCPAWWKMESRHTSSLKVLARFFNVYSVPRMQLLHRHYLSRKILQPHVL